MKTLNSVLTTILTTTLFAHTLAASPSPSPTPTPTLLFVAELCRHGDRTPLQEFPSDALPASKWPEGVGELTAIGQRAHYELGQRLRARYIDTGFLPAIYQPRDIYVRSTDIDRTLVSATSQMAGLFPPGTAPNDDVRVRYGKDALHDDEGGLPHRYQPVPIHTTSQKTDLMLIPGRNCPRHDEIMKRKKEGEKLRAKSTEQRGFLAVVAKLAGRDPLNFTIFDLEHIDDTWNCFHAHSVPLPVGVTPAVLERTRNVSEWLRNYANEGLEVQRLRAGVLLNDIKERMAVAALAAFKKLPDEFTYLKKKFVLYSAHDTTLTATLSAMQVHDGLNPPYNSTVFWELFKGYDDSLMVRVEYNGKALILPGCSSEVCPISEYLASTESVTVAGELQRQVECLVGWRRYSAMVTGWFRRGKHDVKDFSLVLDDRKNDSNTAVGLTTVFFVIGIILVAAVSIFAFRKRSKYKGYSVPPEDAMGNNPYGSRSPRNGMVDRPILM